MPGIYVENKQEKTKRQWNGKMIGLIVGLIIVLCAAAVLLVILFVGKNSYAPPVIQGVQERIEVYEDEDIQAVLLDGVTAVGGEDRPDEIFPVLVSIYDETGKEMSECPPGTYRLVYSCEDGEKAEPVESVLVVLPADTEGPVIEGARDLTVEVGGTISYRDGVSVTDNVDESVQLQIDAGQVNLTQPGEYPVIYSATDAHGNETTVSVTLTVKEAAPESSAQDGTSGVSTSGNVTKEQLDELADRILSQIITAGMSQRQKARAIFDYVYSHIKYVGTSDKSSWITGAYVGLTQGRGDCFNYFACSKELLTRAGIANIDLKRVGGTTDHYWQLVNVGDGWYHFDACPHPTGYPIVAFLLTEAEVRDYTARASSVRKNYYVYDYDACPVTVVGTPADETSAGQSQQPPEETSAQQPQEPPEETSAQQVQEPPEEISAQQSPELPEEELPSTPASEAASGQEAA